MAECVFEFFVLLLIRDISIASWKTLICHGMIGSSSCDMNGASVMLTCGSLLLFLKLLPYAMISQSTIFKAHNILNLFLNLYYCLLCESLKDDR